MMICCCCCCCTLITIVLVVIFFYKIFTKSKYIYINIYKQRNNETMNQIINQSNHCKNGKKRQYIIVI